VTQLEQQLMFARPPSAGDEPPARRHHADKGANGRTRHPLGPEAAADDAGWEALAELYNNMGEDDLMRVVVTQHLARHVGCALCVHALFPHYTV